MPLIDLRGRGKRTYQLLILSVLVARCTSDVAGPPPVVSIQVSPPSAQLQAGGSVQLTATPADADGNPLTGRPVTWSSSNAAVAAVSATGMVTAAVVGSATITATSEGVEGTATVSVSAGVAAQLAFTVQPTTAIAGAAMTPGMAVAVQDAQGNTITDYSGAVTLALASNPGGATLSGTLTTAAVAGVAAFVDVQLDRAGGGYTLLASAGGLAPATSAPFTVLAGAAASLQFTAVPASATAGAPLTPPVAVTAYDALGNVALSFAGSVTVALDANPGGATLAGTTTATAANGVATFANLRLDRAGSGYTLQATAAGLAASTSGTFAVTPGAATRLGFTVQPAPATAGAVIAPPVQVAALDDGGNAVTSYTGAITVALGANPGGGTLSGATTVAAASGVATFSGLSIDRAGTGYTLTAAAPGLTGATSAPFTVGSGTPTHLVFTVAPGDATAGAAIAPAVQVTARDAQGNAATGFAGSITVALGANPGGGTLSGTTTIDATNGVAGFATLSIDRSGTGYTLTATAAGLADATSPGFDIAPGPAATLAFTVQPTTTTAGAPIAPAVQVTARDAQGNTATGFTGDVTVALGANPGGGTLSGTTTVAAAGGVAAFGTLTIDRTGTGYTLSATAGGVPGATSAPFDVTAAPPAQLAFTVPPPGNEQAGAPLTPAVQVAARDALGNVATGFTGDVTVALAANPGGATLSGTATVAAVAGVATFSTLSLDKVGAGYTLEATAAGVPPVTSPPFTITPGPAATLAFTVQPSDVVAGATIAPAVQVTARDAQGNTATGFTGTITVALDANPGGGTPAGTTTVGTANGVGTFSSLSVNRVGVGYTLAATAAGLSGDTSDPFTVTPGAASELVFTVGPSTTPVATPIAPAVQVTARDDQGNTATGFTGDVTVAIVPGSGTAGAVLSGTLTVAAIGGTASFSTLNVDRAGTGYRLAASAAGPQGAQSATFTITSGAATQLVFTVQPGNTTAGAAISPAVQVTARDAQGNTATGFTGAVTVAIGTNPSGGALAGNATIAAVGGVATFPNLSIDKADTGYTLTAGAAGLTGATSGAFTITPGPATQLLFTVQPSTAVAGVPLSPAVRVTARDAQGNTATGFAGSITVAIGTNPAGGTLSGPTTVTALAGVATFSTLSINRAGTGYTLAANAAGLTGATSAAFAIVPGPAALLEFTVQPGNTTAGATITPAVQVTARDAQGNTATGYTGTVSVAIGTNPGGGSLSGTTAVVAAAGVATFSDLAIDNSGTGYTLTAGASGVTGATSAAFDIITGGAAQLAFTVEPSNADAGAIISPAIQVTARDAEGNTVTGFTGNVSLAITPGTGTAGALLSGTPSRTAIAGVATFDDLSIDRAGTDYRLTATAAGLASVTSAPFTITTIVSATLSTLSAATDTVGQCLTNCAVGLDASRITVTIRNASGTPLPGVSVTLSAANPDSVVFVNPGPGGVTDGSGVFRTDVRSGKAVTQTVQASAGGAVLTQTATIAVMPVLVGAGDIARCDLLSDDATANLLDGIPGTVFTLGDNAYPDGTATEFANCYDPTWGRHKARTRPNPGNRDYNTASAAPYYAYFGAAANPSGGSGNEAGYYSFDLGAWHIVSLNTEASTSTNSPQMTWLRQDLDGRRNQCVIAIWHKPLFGSTAAPSGSAEPLWRTVADSGAEIVLNGHAHIYERFAPMDADGIASPNGVREIIVGTGGTSLGGFGMDPPNSVVRDKTTHGVLRIVLYPDRYRWEFIPAPGFGSFTDAGTADCN